MGPPAVVSAILLFGAIYAAVGIWFPNPPASDPSQSAWRLTAWAICLVAFAAHAWREHARSTDHPALRAFRVGAAVALAGFVLAAAANIHAMRAGPTVTTSFKLSLVVWPLAMGIPAFLAAFVLMLAFRLITGRR
jgi:hypothetical protein